MSTGCVHIDLIAYEGYKTIIIHIGVGFCVARSDWIGQCEGLVGRDE